MGVCQPGVDLFGFRGECVQVAVHLFLDGEDTGVEVDEVPGDGVRGFVQFACDPVAGDLWVLMQDTEDFLMRGVLECTLDCGDQGVFVGIFGIICDAVVYFNGSQIFLQFQPVKVVCHGSAGFSDAGDYLLMAASGVFVKVLENFCGGFHS